MLITTSINSKMRVRAQTETEENLIIVVSMLNTFSDSTVSPRPQREGKKRGKKDSAMIMIMMMATCNVSGPAEHDLNRFGMSQHGEPCKNATINNSCETKQRVASVLSPPHNARLMQEKFPRLYVTCQAGTLHGF